MPGATKSKIHPETVRLARGLIEDGFMAGVDWVLDGLRDTNRLEMDEQGREKIHQLARLVVKNYLEAMEENLSVSSDEQAGVE